MSHDTHLELAKSELSDKPTYSVCYKHDSINDFVEYSKTEEGQKYLPQFAKLGGILYDTYLDSYIGNVVEGNVLLQSDYSAIDGFQSENYKGYRVYSPGKHTRFFNLSRFNDALDYFIEQMKEIGE